MKYYLIERGPGPGAVPRDRKNLITNVEDFGSKIYVEEIGRRAWGTVEYMYPLDKKLIDDYEFIEVSK
jgi:hypothetical protein